MKKQVKSATGAEGVNVLKIQGEIYDELVNVKTGEVKVLRNWERNTIVLEFGKLLAYLCKQLTAASFATEGLAGIQKWAVGEGLASWDVSGVPSPSTSATQLISEVARVTVSMDFLDALNEVTTTVTNKLEISATFDESVEGELREFGLFGGKTAEVAVADGGIMVNLKNHSKIDKTSATILNRQPRTRRKGSSVTSSMCPTPTSMSTGM